MQWAGHLTFTLRLGEGFAHVPNHLDYVLGTTRAVSHLDGGPLDRVIRKWGGGGRALGLYPSRRGLGRAGEHGAGFDDVEEQFGLSRTYRLEGTDPARNAAVGGPLRGLALREFAALQFLTTPPLGLAAASHHTE